MLRRPVSIFAVFIMACASVHAADEVVEPKPKGVDVVSDVAVGVIRKANAFFQGNLEITMPPDNDRYKNRNSYSRNAIGQRVPGSTNTQNPGAVHSE